MARRVLGVAARGFLAAPAGAVGVGVRGRGCGTKVLGAMAGGRPPGIRDGAERSQGEGAAASRELGGGPGVLGRGICVEGRREGEAWGSRGPGRQIRRPCEQGLCRSMGAGAAPGQARV